MTPRARSSVLLLSGLLSTACALTPAQPAPAAPVQPAAPRQPTASQPVAAPPVPGQHLAVWLRPPASAAELERTLVAARQAGFTDVLLEGFYHGRAIWDSRVAPMKLSYDALKVAAEVTQREGLGLNVWMETLYWRPAPQFGIPVTPLWRDEDATLTAGGQPSLTVSKLGFVDPASPRVGEVLEALVRDLATQYPAVGLHLDYLRYPREVDFGYHPAAVAGFLAASGKTPLEDPQGWAVYRQGLISGLAGRLIGSYRAAGGQGMVSAAVFGASDPLQDWRRWPGLQVAMPMLYYPYTWLYGVTPGQFPPGTPTPGGLWPGIQVGAGYPALATQRDSLRRLGYGSLAVFGWTPPAAAQAQR